MNSIRLLLPFFCCDSCVRLLANQVTISPADAQQSPCVAMLTHPDAAAQDEEEQRLLEAELRDFDSRLERSARSKKTMY